MTPRGGCRHSQAGSWQADILGLCLGLEFPLHSPMSKHPVSCLPGQNLDLTSASHQPRPSWVALWRRPGRGTGMSPLNYMDLYKRVCVCVCVRARDSSFSVSPGHLSLSSPPHTILPEALWVFCFFFWMPLQCAFFSCVGGQVVLNQSVSGESFNQCCQADPLRRNSRGLCDSLM